MPWKVSGVVEKRKQFLVDYESGEWTMTDLCRVYGITRPTGYTVLRRYEQEGVAGLEERSRAPQRHPNQTSAAIEERVLALRRKHPRWGPRTLKKVLERQEPELGWPAASTIGDMLDREGLTQHRVKRRKVEPYQQPFRTVWSRTTNGQGTSKAGCEPAMEAG
jgi:putative transposase